MAIVVGYHEKSLNFYLLNLFHCLICISLSVILFSSRPETSWMKYSIYTVFYQSANFRGLIMKGNYRVTWERGYHCCHFRGWAEGYFAGGTRVLECGLLATKALVLAVVLREMQRSWSLPFSLLLISFITQQPLCPLRVISSLPSLLAFPFSPALPTPIALWPD